MPANEQRRRQRGAQANVVKTACPGGRDCPIRTTPTVQSLMNVVTDGCSLGASGPVIAFCKKPPPSPAMARNDAQQYRCTRTRCSHITQHKHSFRQSGASTCKQAHTYRQTGIDTAPAGAALVCASLQGCRPSLRDGPRRAETRRDAARQGPQLPARGGRPAGRRVTFFSGSGPVTAPRGAGRTVIASGAADNISFIDGAHN